MKSIYYLFLLSLMSFYACDPDDPAPVNEEEVITTVRYTLVPKGGGSTVVLTFRDLDGDGGNAPVITGGTLLNNTLYGGTLEFLNETKNPVEDITAEVKEEGTEHQVFFTVSSQALADAFEYSYDDADTNGKPIGLKTTMQTLNTATGNLIVTLRHKPNKSASEVAEGNITNAGGETDVEVSFPVEIK